MNVSKLGNNVSFGGMAMLKTKDQTGKSTMHICNIPDKDIRGLISKYDLVDKCTKPVMPNSNQEKIVNDLLEKINVSNYSLGKLNYFQSRDDYFEADGKFGTLTVASEDWGMTREMRSATNFQYNA